MCPTQASLNIVRRTWRLGSPANSLAAVYRDPITGERHLITASQVTIFLRHVAHKVFDIPAGHKDLLAWSCHSIRVTAANLLHRAWFSDSYIKNCLRWCSDTFLMFCATPSTRQTNTQKLSHLASTRPTAALPGLWNPMNHPFAPERLNQEYTF
jgi:hypothetical protein